LSFTSIPWKEYSEIEMQDVITRCFETAGYSVSNIHKSDPAGEKGVDLLAQLEENKTVIAVKVKPKATDRAQLQDLAEYPADRRVYVYTDTPTHDFIKFTQRKDIKPLIEFWSPDIIGNQLFSLDPFLVSELTLSYSEFCMKCISIALNVMQIWEESKDMKEEEHEDTVKSIDPTIVTKHTLWEAKDHSSSLNKSAWVLRELFSYMMNIDFAQEQQSIILGNVESMLIDFSRIVLDRLQWVIEDLIKNYRMNLLRVASSTRYRTNWKQIGEFLREIRGLFPKRVMDTLSELRVMSALWNVKSSSDSGEIVDFSRKIDEIQRSYSRGIAGIKYFFAQVFFFASGIEEFVNDIYTSVLDQGFDGHFRDWLSDPSKEILSPPYYGIPSDSIFAREWLGLGKAVEPLGITTLVKEVLVTRWHLITGKKELECPQCKGDLVLFSKEEKNGLKCEDCDYTFGL
jgi:hypothetical protein